MPQGNLVEVVGREVKKGLPGELMVESSPSRQRRPPCKTSKEMSDEAADAAALTYLLTDSECSCLAMLAKPYPVSGLTPLPQIPNQLYLIQKSAHEVLGATLEA